MAERERIMTTVKVILVAVGGVLAGGILIWLNSPLTAAGLEITVSAVFWLGLLSRTRSRERWALALFAVVAFLFLLTGASDFWLFTSGTRSDNVYRAILTLGNTARGLALGCFIALWASGELLGKKCTPRTPII